MSLPWSMDATPPSRISQTASADGGGGAAMPAGSARAEEWNKAAFGSEKLDELISSWAAPRHSRATRWPLIGPEIAENGAVVPLEVEEQAAEHRVHRHPDREEPEHPRRHLHAPCWHPSGHSDTGENGGDLQRLRPGNGRRQALLRGQKSR